MIKKLQLLIDPEENSIRKFVKNLSEKIQEGALVLDAGAGTKPYANFFSHTRYESTDFGHMFDTTFKGQHDFICDLSAIPKPDSHYDVILCTQVLEHVAYPAKVLQEFNRILKPGGKIILTVPQGWGVHGAPYHFFNFTKFGIEILAKDAGLEIVSINERGGYFNYIAQRLMHFVPYIYNQYRKQLKKYHIFLISLPFYALLKIVIGLIIPGILLTLDKVDKKRDFTLGYECVLKK